MKYRTTLHVAAAIVKTCMKEPSTRTNIMFDCRLSYTQLKDHLKELVEKGFLVTNDNRYSATPTGKTFVDAMEQVIVLTK